MGPSFFNSGNYAQNIEESKVLIPLLALLVMLASYDDGKLFHIPINIQIF